MNNNILRTEKVKTRQQITAAAEHNFRIRTQSNIDASKTPQNRILVNTLNVDTKNASDLQKQLSNFYDGLGIKEKSNNVLMMEFVVSASPEFFEGKTAEQIEGWAAHQVEFFKAEFGQQLKIGVLHVDEKTPHLHFMIGTEFEETKKYKNQKGEFHKKAWSLNARRYNPEFLIGLHDRHAAHNKKYELKRGVRGSLRKHTSLKEFYDLVDKALSTDYEKRIEHTLKGLKTGLLGGVSLEEIREKFGKTLNEFLKQNKALKKKYDFELKDLLKRLSIEKEAFEKERDEVRAQSAYYGEGLKKIMMLEKELVNANKEIEALKKLIPQKTIASLQPNQNLKKSI